MPTNFKRTFGNATSPLALSYLDDNFSQLEAAGTSTVTLSGAQLIGFMQSGSGAVSRSVEEKLQETNSVTDFGAQGDSSAQGSGTDDSTDIQEAVTAQPAHTLGAISGTAASAVLGGGRLSLAAKALAYRLGVGINLTKSKLIIEGPARINVDATLTAILFHFSGSAEKSGIIFRHIDFFGGAIAFDIGTNADAMPMLAEHCSFINQTTASIKTGNNGFWVDLYRCRFAGNQKAIWHQGSSSDGLNIERCVFEYNAAGDMDILVENGANVLYVQGCDFIGNKSADKAHIHIDTTTAQSGSYSVIERNKFGTESRTAGNIIRITGTNPLISTRIVNNPLMGFDGAVGAAIKCTTPLKGCIIKDNNLTSCTLFDSGGTQVTDGNDGDNIVGPNYFTSTIQNGLQRGNSIASDVIEPSDKYNLLAWSRWENAGGNFTYTNATPSYLSVADQNGNANSATTVLATAANNVLRINSLDTNSTQKFYTFSIWWKLDTAGNVTIQATRGSNAAFNKVFSVGTTYQRNVIEFYQTYLAAGNPYVIDITIPNGATITLGDTCVVAGRDAGDLWSYVTSAVKQIGPRLYRATAIPTAGYFTAGAFVRNDAPSIDGNNMVIAGWIRLTTGNAHVSGTDWAIARTSTVSPAT